MGPERDLVTGEWRKLHSEELNELYSSTNKLSGHQIENEMGGACSAYGGEDRHIQGFGGKIILRWIFRKWDVRIWLNRAGSG